MWIDIVRINDKALTIVTGLVLLLGVGTLAHKGDEFFAPKTVGVEIAKADLNKTDALPDTFNSTLTQIPNSISIPAKSIPAKGAISDFKLVRSEASPSTIAIESSIKAVKDEPIALDCNLNLNAKPLRGARVLLEIIAPCHKRKTVLISHAGLRFNEIVGDKGMISIIIPVLSDPANIEVSFADGISKSISAPAKDLSLLQRTGIAWSGQSDLNLHAYESSYDATRNAQITDQNGRSYQQYYLQGGGYITTLGNKNVEGGKFAQIYSIENPNDIFVDFKIAIEQPHNRCGSTLTIKTMRYTAELGAQIADKNVVYSRD